VLPLGSLAGGYLLSAAGPTRTIWALAAAMLAAAVAATLSPAVRQAPSLTGGELSGVR